VYTTLRSPYGMSRPSVCLTSVTLLRPTQRVKNFGDIFAPFDSVGTWVVFDILNISKISKISWYFRLKISWYISFVPTLVKGQIWNDRAKCGNVDMCVGVGANTPTLQSVPWLIRVDVGVHCVVTAICHRRRWCEQYTRSAAV